MQISTLTDNQLPLISIITVVYNGEKYLEKTIQSVINQTYPNVEYIIIDGGSTDGTLDIIKKYEDKIDYWVSEKDKGIYDAMNKGIDVATGEWINFMNAGDIFAIISVLESVIKRTKEEKFNIVYGGANVYSEDGRLLSVLKPFDLNKKNLNRYATRVVCHQSIFVNKSVIKHYSDKYILKGELNWYYDLVENTEKEKVLRLDEMICNYYLGGKTDKNFWKDYIERIKVTKEHNSVFEFLLTASFFVLPLIFRFRRIVFGK